MSTFKQITIQAFIVLGLFVGVLYNANSYANTKREYDSTLIEKARAVSIIIMALPETRDCKDAALYLYIWFREHNLSPKIQIGEKWADGRWQGHMWLEYNGEIFDATDPCFIGLPTKNLKTIYRPRKDDS